MDKREQTRLRVQRYRERQSVTQPTPESVTKALKDVTQDVTQYPAILDALIDPVKRRKLEKIYQSLKALNVLSEIRYGTRGPTFDVIGDLLDATC